MSQQLGVHLFTIRDFTKTATDLKSSLQKIAAIGYPAVQIGGMEVMQGETPEVDISALRGMLEECNLKCAATRKSWEEVSTRTDQVIEFQKSLDCDYVAIGSIKHNYPQTSAGFRQFLADAAPVVATLKSEGIAFGFHNHFHEFARETRHGETLLDIIIEEGGPDINLELDLYWVRYAGANPAQLVQRCKNRVRVVHLKDTEVDLVAGPRMTAIGEGNMDWDAIIAACRSSGVAYYILDLDTCNRDVFDCLKSSFDFLEGKGL